MRFPILLPLVLPLLPALANSQQDAWQQCGGISWTGGTTCISGYTCTVVNELYHQCVSSGQAPTSTRPAISSFAPVPKGTWRAAIAKARAAVARISLQDKVSLATGTGWQNGHCIGVINPIPSIDFPGLCLQDGPLGARNADLISVFPAAINAAATFDRKLIYQRGVALGEEFRGKGINVVLGPAMNMARIPAAGRNWEGFGGDPYLAGEAAYETVRGIQSVGVQACAKHYINNEQERNRGSSSSNVDDRTQHEVYAAPFLKSVQAGLASVMCSYNQINSSWACENDKTLNGILKNEFGFNGYVLSDWWGTHSTLAVNRGLDMTMPGDISPRSGTSYFGQNLTNAVTSGQVSEARINDVATRILAAWYLLGQDSGYPPVNFHGWDLNDPFNKHVNVQGNHARLIRRIAAASTVLLKNTNNALPLRAPRTVAIIGSHAAPAPGGPNAFVDRGGNEGVLGQGWGSGTAEYPYLSDPLSAIRSRADRDDSAVSYHANDTDTNGAANTAAGKAVAIVFITSDSGEGYITVEGHAGDRSHLQAWHNGDNLVLATAQANANTIVVVNTVGQVNMEAWIDHVNVTAVLWAGLPGQEAGNSLVDVLYGTVNPSGRLPYTIARRDADYSASISSSQQIPYTEGLQIDYRHFDANNITPRFPFGFGLSYTTFAYKGPLRVRGRVAGGVGPEGNGFGSSLDSRLHATTITVSFRLTNNGKVSGTEIPQLYISFPSSTNSPLYVLKGFSSVSLAAGASTPVSFPLSRYDLSIWDVGLQRWRVPTGTIGLSVGGDSRDRRLTGSITVS